MKGGEAAQGAGRAHDLLVAHLEQSGFNDTMARHQSALPGWSVGHLLTHLARNADSHSRMVDAANDGRVVVQYPGGAAQRESDIALGAGRPAAQLIEDLTQSGEALSAAWGRVEPGTWARAACRFSDQPWPLFDLAFLRWREVAIHTIDVGLDSFTTDMWSDDYVDHELLRQVAGLSPRLPGRQGVFITPGDSSWSTVVLSMGDDDASPYAMVDASSREVLAWLVGRSPGRSDWPRLSDWQGIP